MSIFEKKRIAFNFKNLFKRIHDSENFILIALDYFILQKMVNLREIPELHDKIIVATAKYLNLPLMTKDASLRELSYVETIW